MINVTATFFRYTLPLITPPIWTQLQSHIEIRIQELHVTEHHRDLINKTVYRDFRATLHHFNYRPNSWTLHFRLDLANLFKKYCGVVPGRTVLRAASSAFQRAVSKFTILSTLDTARIWLCTEYQYQYRYKLLWCSRGVSYGIVGILLLNGHSAKNLFQHKSSEKNNIFCNILATYGYKPYT